MQFPNSAQQAWFNVNLPLAGAAQRRPAQRKPELCGWYDSSFDLVQGLEVTEQDNDTLYQLWELARR